MSIKEIPGIPPDKIVAIRQLTVSPSRNRLMITGDMLHWTGEYAAENMVDGKLYYVAVGNLFLYRRHRNGKYEVVGVGTEQVVPQSKSAIYSTLSEEIAAYMKEGLHPDDIFDIILL